MLVILPVLSFATIIPLALVLIILGVITLATGTRRVPAVNLDEMADVVVRRVATRKIYKSADLRIVPMVEHPGSFHVVILAGRCERITTAVSLAMVHTLVAAHFANLYA